MTGTNDVDTPRLYKVCKNEQEAREFKQDQEDRLRNKGLHRIFEVDIEPVSHTRDNYRNGRGPWGVYLHNKF